MTEGVKRGGGVVMRLRPLRQAARRLARRLIPGRFHLPLDVWWAGMRGRLEPELDVIPLLVRRRRTAVDVGSNRGDYAYKLCQWFERAVVFEANPEVLSALRAYPAHSLHIHNVGLSSRDGTARLFIPVSEVGVSYTGWGSLNRQQIPDAPTVREMEVSLRTLDSFDLTEVDFIKIDVEGHESEVLIGGDKTITMHRPVVLLEVKPENRHSVGQFFRERGYRFEVLEEGQLRPPTNGLENYCGVKENFFALPS